MDSSPYKLADGVSLFFVYAGDDVFKIGLGLEEKATMDAIVAAVNTGWSCGGDNSGFSGEYGKKNQACWIENQSLFLFGTH